MKTEILKIGSCKHPEKVVLPQGSLFKNMFFPSTVGLIEHPANGFVLFDTGYAPRIFDICSKFPESLYTLITPVELQPQESLLFQLSRRGISPEDIKYIIISHFHADHIGGLKDFPNAKIICSKKDIPKLRKKNRIGRLTNAFLLELLPDLFDEQAIYIETMDEKIIQTQYKYFDKGIDLFDDQSLIIVNLPGHTNGQIGLMVNDEKKSFFIADACWHKKSYQEIIYPHFVTKIIHDNFKIYKNTIEQLHFFSVEHPEVSIIPCHCSQTLQEIREPA